MSKHIRALEVQSFRGLQKLCIKDLAPLIFLQEIIIVEKQVFWS